MSGSNHYRHRIQTRPAISCRLRRALKLFSSLLNMAHTPAALDLTRQRVCISVLATQLDCATLDALAGRRRSRLQRRQAMLVQPMVSKLKEQVRLLTLLQSQPLYRPLVRSTKLSKLALKHRRTRLDPCSLSSDTSGYSSVS
jgi:hypothetical protein